MNIVSTKEILVPKKDIDLNKWAVVACDQFTSQPDYWTSLGKYTEGAYSTFNLIYPEVWLEDNRDARIKKIEAAMDKYLSDGIFEKITDSFILVERDTPYSKTRLGLVAAVDLEAYDFTPFAEACIRATEGTIIERIPPRVEIRKNAKLELPHIMLLIDDRDKKVIEPLYEKRDDLELLYDCELNMCGGHIKGYRVTDAQAVLDNLYGLLEDAVQLKNYKKVTNFLFAVGDGNHSLATAKAHWENVKSTLTEAERVGHPARYALVEIENLHGDALKFEPIHRVVFGDTAGISEVLGKLNGSRKIKAFTQDAELAFSTAADSIDAIKEIQDCIDGYLKRNPEASVDYVHGEDNLREVVAKKGGLGILMPAPEKESLFDFIIRKGIMPRKSFSMGEAEEKRYYLEAKMIVK